MFYNPFRKIYAAWPNILYVGKYKDWFHCCVNLLADDHFNDPENATLGLLDYFFVLPALVKIARFYSQGYPVIAAGLGILNFILTVVSLSAALGFTVLITPLLYLVHIPFYNKGKQQRERNEQREQILNLKLLPITEDNKQCIVRGSQSNSFSVTASDLNSRFFSKTLKQAFPEGAEEIKKGTKKKLCIYFIKTLDASDALTEECILILCRKENNKTITPLALIEPNKATHHGLYSMEALGVCSFLIIPSLKRMIFTSCPDLERANKRKRETQDSTHAIFESLSFLPADVNDLIAGHAEKLAIQRNSHGICSPIEETFLILNKESLHRDFAKYYCSITDLIMFDPVFNELCDHYYECTEIETWCEKQRFKEKYVPQEEVAVTCPSCKAPITNLVKDASRKDEITELLTQVNVQLEQDRRDNPYDAYNNTSYRISMLICKFLEYGNGKKLLKERYKHRFHAHRPDLFSTESETDLRDAHTFKIVC